MKLRVVGRSVAQLMELDRRGRCGKEYSIVTWVHNPPPPHDNSYLKFKTLEWTKGDITNGRQRVN